MPVTESLELTAENLNNQNFLSVVANILQQLNEQMVSKELDTDELTKILSQVAETKSFFEQIKASSVNNYVSEANELLTNLHSTIETTINEIKDNYNADLTQLKETLLSSVQLSEEKTQSINTILSELQTKKEELKTAFSDLESFKGDQGIQGLQGEKGDQGLQGIQGEKGDQGIQGEKGLDGVVTFESLSSEQVETLRGVQGLQGIQGEKGDQGLQGIQGEKGDQGIQGIQGVKGNDGTNGQDGANGNDGANGLNGTDGKSTYELAKDNGFTGTLEQYLSSLKANTDYTLLADYPILKTNGVITLSESFDNFELLCFVHAYREKVYPEFKYIITSLLESDVQYMLSSYNTRYIDFFKKSTTTFEIKTASDCGISKIYGIGRK